MKGFGHYVQELRKNAGKREADICDFLNISPAQLYQIENNKITIGKDLVFKLAIFMNGDLRELLILHQQDRIISEIKNIDFTNAGLYKENGYSSDAAMNARHQNLLKTYTMLVDTDFNVQAHKPSYPLDELIESITYCKAHNLNYEYEKIMPYGSAQLVIELDDLPRSFLSDSDSRPMKKTWLSCIQTQPAIFQVAQSRAIVYIRFHPGGLFGLTGIPQISLKNVTLEADLVFGPSILDLRERMLTCADTQEIFRILREYFLRMFKPSKTEDEVIKYICKNIQAPLPYLIRKSGYSQKHLIHLFKNRLGITPKNFQRVHRFNNSLHQIQTIRGKPDWSSLVFDNGYYDQAHFVKEFGCFSNFNPGQYSGLAPACPNFIHSSEGR